MRWLVRFYYKKVTFKGINFSIFEHEILSINSCAFISSNESYSGAFLSAELRFFCNHIQANEILCRQIAVCSHEPPKVFTYEPWFMGPCKTNIEMFLRLRLQHLLLQGLQQVQLIV